IGLSRTIFDDQGNSVEVRRQGKDDASHGSYSDRVLRGISGGKMVWQESIPALSLNSVVNPVNGQIIFQHTPDYSGQLSSNGLIDWLSFNDSLRTWSMDPKGNTFWDMRLGAINVLEDLAIMSNGDVVMPWINMEAITGTDGAARQTV